MSRPEIVSTAHYGSSDERRYYELWKLSDQVFQEKNLPTTTGHSLAKYFSQYYNFLVHDNETFKAKESLEEYRDVIIAIRSIEDEEKLQEICEKMDNWMENIEKIYAESGDFHLYIEGHEKMFQVMFAFFKSEQGKALVDKKTTKELAVVLDEPEGNNEVV